MSEEYRKLDAADYIKTAEGARGLLRAAKDEELGEGAMIRAALKRVAQTQNISALARNTGLNRGNIYEALLKVTNALGLRLRREPVEDRALGAQPTGAGVFQQESTRQPNRISRRWRK